MKDKKIFYVSYNFRWDFIGVMLFAENELDAIQKADHHVFNKPSYPISQQELKSFDIDEIKPNKNCIIDAEHSSYN